MEKVQTGLPAAAKIAQRLFDAYGVDQIGQIQQMSEHVYRVMLNTGELAAAVVLTDGQILLKTLEPAW